MSGSCCVLCHLRERRLCILQDRCLMRIAPCECDDLLELCGCSAVVVTRTLPQEHAQVEVTLQEVLIRFQRIAYQLDGLVTLPGVEVQDCLVDLGVVVVGGYSEIAIRVADRLIGDVECRSGVRL